LQRLRAAAVLDEASRARLVALAEALDPVQALRQLHLLQEALWRHAVAPAPAMPTPTVRCILPQAAAVAQGAAVSPQARLRPPHPERHTRRGAQTNATRADPCADEADTRTDPCVGKADTIDAGLVAQPERPAAERSADGLRKERRQQCQGCGDLFSVFPLERERTSAYCARCGDERRRAQARARMQALRAPHRTGAG